MPAGRGRQPPAGGAPAAGGPPSADPFHCSPPTREGRSICFSTAANLVAGTAVSAVGVATIAAAPSPRQRPLAGLPLLLGVHQLVEAAVWLSVDGRLGDGAGAVAVNVYVLVAQALLPALVPLVVWWSLRGRRDRILLPFVVLGTVVGAAFTVLVVQGDVTAQATDTTIVYDTGATPWPLVVAYVVVTVGPFLVSGRRFLAWFGILSAVGAAIVLLVQATAFTSLWCFWAAVVSVALYLDMRRGPARSGPRRDARLSSGAA